MKAQVTQHKFYSMGADYLRSLAILAVVMIHTTTKTLEIGKFDIHQFWWSLFLNQVFRFAVPLFFLISGFLLELNYKDDLQITTFFKKRFSKILIPYFFWSLFYTVIAFQNPFTTDFFHNLLIGGASYQLYFIPTLFIFYFLFPLFHQFRRFFLNKYILIPLILIEVWLLAQDYYLSSVWGNTPIRTALLNYIPFLLGMWSSHHIQHIVTFIKKWKLFFFFLVTILGLSVFYQSFFYFLSTNSIRAIYSQYRPVILLYTIGLAGLLYVIFEGYSKHKAFLLMLSRLSFFVFFIHVAILNFYTSLLGPTFPTATYQHIIQQFWYDPFVFLVVTVMSFGTAYLCNKKLHLAWLMG